MTLKQLPNSAYAPDGSLYITLTDGAGNLSSAGGGGSSTITANSTATSGFTAGQIPYSDGSKIQVAPTATFNASTSQFKVLTQTPHLASNGATILVNGNTANEVTFTHPVSVCVQGADAENCGFNVGSFGTGTTGNFVGRHALGTAASPSADTADTELTRFLARGYRTTGYSNNIGGITINAAGTFTDTSTPTYLTFVTCPTGSTNTLTESTRIQPTGGVSVGDAAFNATDPGAGKLAIKTGLLVGAGAALTSTGAGGALVASAFTDTTVATNISSGSLADARLSANIPLLNASTNAFTSTLQSISGGATLPTPTTNASVQIAHGTTSGVALELDSFNGNGFVAFRRANTSSTAPSAIVSNNQLGNFQFTGWNTSAYAVGASLNARSTATTWDGTHNGAFLAFFTTADASVTVTEQLRIQGSGGLSVGNANVATDGGTGVVVATSFTGAGTGLTGTAASLTAGAVTTNANLTGPIASSGNATSITAQTGTGTTFVMNTNPTIAGSLTLSSAGFITSGSLSAAAWTTNGVRTQMAAASYTDTSSSGTVANAYTDLFGVGTILASSATTYTSYYGAFFKNPVASTNVTMTNKSALGADTISIGGAAQSTFALAVTGTASISGALMAASLNGNTFTTGTYTLTGQAGKTLTFNGSITLTGTDAQTYTFPTTTATIARTDTAQTFTGSNTFTNSTNFGGNISLTANGGVIQLRTNATLITSPASASLQHGAADVDTGPVAQTIRSQGALAGGTSDVAGANFTFLASPGKGTGAGGSFIFQTTPAGSTGTVVGTATTALTITSTQQTAFSGTAKLASFTVASLPSASTSGAGSTAFVTDASTTLVLGLGGTVAGGGSNKVPVYSDGTNWVYG